MKFMPCEFWLHGESDSNWKFLRIEVSEKPLCVLGFIKPIARLPFTC